MHFPGGFHRRFRRRWRRFAKKHATGAHQQDLARSLRDAPVGANVRILYFAPGLTAGQTSHLLAYGLLPGSCVRVLQQKPVTVVQVEHLELALEHNLAGKILIG